ncbi:MAG: ATP-grasp domain-containing protein [Candidatus Lokiarchaeota archaeon]|nr:ATP-grasp domain-containing protein [Candidatus Lokiarchaeota archaeon]
MEDKIKKFINSSNFLIIGFNTRPIIKSAINLGVENIDDIDFFGDFDLLNIMKNVTIISELVQANFDKKSIQDIFYDELKRIIKEKKEISHIIITSGFDNRADIWKKIENLKPIIGNSSDTVKKVRNIKILSDFCRKKRIKFPNFIDLATDDQINKLKFPLIIKPKSSGGGKNIHLIERKEDFEELFTKILNRSDFIAQEFVKGIDISATISCNGHHASILTITKQILGEKFLGASSKFLYCGNIIPFKVNKKVYGEIGRISNEITKNFELKGINGMDFILKDGEIYLIEVNPRFPGTIELIEMLMHKNIFYEHVKSSIFEEISKFDLYDEQIGLKFILYATKEIKIGNFIELNNIYDIPKPGSKISMGSPICSILIIGNELNNIWDDGLKTTNDILRKCH